MKNEMSLMKNEMELMKREILTKFQVIINAVLKEDKSINNGHKTI